MNTAILNAADHRRARSAPRRSRPIAVTSAGTTPTQIALFWIAVTSVSVVNSVLVVVEPDELRRPTVEEAADDRADRRIDDPDAEQHRGRSQEDAVMARLAPSRPEPARARRAAGGRCDCVTPALIAPLLLEAPSRPTPRACWRCRRRRTGSTGSPGGSSTRPGRRAAERAGARSDMSKRNVSALASAGRRRARHLVGVRALAGRSCSARRTRRGLTQISRASGLARYLTSAWPAGRVLEHHERVAAADDGVAAGRRSPGTGTRRTRSSAFELRLAGHDARDEVALDHHRAPSAGR